MIVQRRMLWLIFTSFIISAMFYIHCQIVNQHKHSRLTVNDIKDFKLTFVREIQHSRKERNQTERYFYSSILYGNDYISVLRKANPTDDRTRLAIIQSDQEKELHLFGEDPRIVRFQRFHIINSWLKSGEDWDHFIYILEKNQTLNTSHCVTGFRGKNWIPLITETSFWMAYRIHPEIAFFEIEFMDNMTRIKCKPVNKFNSKQEVSQWRGGTPFVQIPEIENTYLSVGHRTTYPNGWVLHEPFLLFVQFPIRDYMPPVIVKYGQQSLKSKRGGIFDPTNIWHQKGKFYISVTKTIGISWDQIEHNSCEECWFNNSIYELDLI